MPVFREAVEAILLLVSPMVPHIAEELWQALGHEHPLAGRSLAPAPGRGPEGLGLDGGDPGQRQGEEPTKGVRPRLRMTDIKDWALADPAIEKWLKGKPPKKVILARRKLVNIVI